MLIFVLTFIFQDQKNQYIFLNTYNFIRKINKVMEVKNYCLDISLFYVFVTLCFLYTSFLVRNPFRNQVVNSTSLLFLSVFHIDCRKLNLQNFHQRLKFRNSNFTIKDWNLCWTLCRDWDFTQNLNILKRYSVRLELPENLFLDRFYIWNKSYSVLGLFYIFNRQEYFQTEGLFA